MDSFLNLDSLTALDSNPWRSMTPSQLGLLLHSKAQKLLAPDDLARAICHDSVKIWPPESQTVPHRAWQAAHTQCTLPERWKPPQSLSFASESHL